MEQLTKVENIIFITLVASFYGVLHIVIAWITPSLVPSFKKLSVQNQRNWPERFTSFFNLLIVISLSLYGINYDESPRADIMFGSSPLSVWLMKCASGYFLYDIFISVICYFDLKDIVKSFKRSFGFLMHAFACLAVFYLATVRIILPKKKNKKKPLI